MKSIIDREKLQRRARASHAASLGGLLMLLATVLLLLWRPDLTTLSAFLLFAGFAVATIGTYYANRWVKKPRPEDLLDHALKGLDDRCRLYHYLPRGPDHLLLTPSGLVVLETRAGEGFYEYSEGRWRQKMTLGKALRFFVEEPLGNPVADAQRSAARLARALEARLLPDSALPIHAVVVFTHPSAVLHAKRTPIPVCQPKQLRALLPKGLSPLPAATYEQVRSILDGGGPF
ncbi:MAG: nuclease-related domain-containing protein [Chloroflexota bacterium]